MNTNPSAATSTPKRSRASASPDVTKEPPKLRAVLDGRHLPIELFGCGRASYTRKLVYNYIATWANPDGTDAYPGRETIARDCGLTVRGLSNLVSWLEEHGLIRVEYKASLRGTNRYTVLFSEEDQAACRAALKLDEEQQRLRAKAEQTSQARRLAAKSRWGKQKAKGTGDQEQYLPAEHSEIENTGFPKHQERIASDGERFACEQGTGCMEPGTHGSPDRPLDRPEVNRQSIPSTTPSTTASGKTRDPNPPSSPAADAVDDVLASSLNTDGQNLGAAFDRDRFMADVWNVLKEGDASTASTQSHRERAFAIAGEHGRDLFIAALERWLDEEGHLMRRIPKGEDPRSGQPRFEERTWVLEYFVSSGAALRYIKRVEAVFALGVKSPEGIETVDAILQAGDRLTPEQAQALARLSSYEDDGLGVGSVLNGITFAGSVDDFLSSPKEWVERYWAQRRGESAAKRATLVLPVSESDFANTVEGGKTV